ncbi:33370_t:CDS:1, partial [Gigaspora margarita]
DIKKIRESRGKIPNASKKMAEKFHIRPKRVYEIWDNKECLQQGRDQVNPSQPEVLPVITALKNVVRDGEAKPNSSEVLEGDSKVGIKPGSQREDLWRDRDQEKTGEKKLKSKSVLALPTLSTNQQTFTSLNNLDINKEELDAS